MSDHWKQYIGTEESHLTGFSLDEREVLIHHSIKNDLNGLIEAAAQAGLPITIVSSFRSFEHQLKIWNEKWQGHRAVLSRHGRQLNVEQLSNIEKYKAISLWSALPGLSRHHWGTDLDIFSKRAITDGHKVELTPEEFSKNGVCDHLNNWLSENLQNYGFFRPYRVYQQGVSCEPWHISHISVANNMLNNFPYDHCRSWLAKSHILDKDFILDHFEHYKAKYFLNICNYP